MSAAAAMRLLANQLRNLEQEPVEGFTVRADESNIFKWDVWIEGPSDTAYAGGIFKLRLEFPQDFPLNPPQLFFVSDFWHPNGKLQAPALTHTYRQHIAFFFLP